MSQCWFAAGNTIQKMRWLIVLLLLAIGIPVAIFSMREFTHSAGLVPMMPSTSEATHSLGALQDAFGVQSVFPTSLLIVPHTPPKERNSTWLKTWLGDACNALDAIVTDVNQDVSLDVPFQKSDFLGAMMMAGLCMDSQASYDKTFWSADNNSATKVSIQFQIDPFSSTGSEWTKALRKAVAKQHSLGDWYVYGQGPTQMDVADKTFGRLPLMVALMMGIVVLIIGAASQSVVAPLRAVLCLIWMLVITFGIAIFVFQDGMLNFLDFSQLGGRESGAMHWMSPCMALSVVVGLGLDYDIFFSERMIEEREHGYSDTDAAKRALGFTANIISAAGVIMVLAFASLVISSTPVLNEIGFLLILGVLVDCFLTTKFIIPSVMAILDGVNLWPRRFHDEQSRQEDVFSSSDIIV